MSVLTAHTVLPIYMRMRRPIYVRSQALCEWSFLPVHGRRFGGGGGASARSSAAAAGEKMRETMAGSLAAMKNLNLGFSRNTRE